METKNAVIESTMLGIEDHGIMPCFLYLNYGGSVQGFGGYGLDGFDKAKAKRVGTAWGMEFVRRVLETFEVDSWEKLYGKHCRVVADHGKVYRWNVGLEPMTVIDLMQAKQKREPHLSGKARCLSCKHEWVAVAPVGVIWMECPSCTLERGRYVAHAERDSMRWGCNCGNDLFYATPDGFYCPNCGEWQHGF